MELVTDPSLLATSIVPHPLDISAFLRRMTRRQVPVWFKPVGGAQIWSSTLHSVDDVQRNLRIWVPGVANRADADALRVACARGGTLVGELDGARIQFAIEGLGPERQNDGWVLVGPLPRRTWRFQRREAYRVATSTGESLLLRIRTPQGYCDRGLVDISEHGVRIRFEDDSALPAPGTRWRDAFLELPDAPLLRANLEVRWAATQAAQRGRPEVHWAGSAMAGMDADQAQLLRRWINEKQVQSALIGGRESLGVQLRACKPLSN